MLLSVIAMYNYDNTLFEDLENCLPTSPSNSEYAVENYTPIDFQTMVNLIMLRAGELSLVYSQPSLLKWSIGVWAKTQKGKWQALFDTLWYRYDPMFSKIRSYALDRNTTRNSDTTDDITGRDTDSVNRTDKTIVDKDSTSKNVFTETGKTDDNVSGSYSDYKSGTNNENVNLTDTTYVQAFNDVGANEWHEKDKVTHTGTDNYTTGENDSGTNSSHHDITNKVDNTTNITDTDDVITDFTQKISDILDKKVNRAIKLIDKGTVKDIITETIEGQAPFQELVKLQREIAEFNLYNYIADDFVANFCIMVY